MHHGTLDKPKVVFRVKYVPRRRISKLKNVQWNNGLKLKFERLQNNDRSYFDLPSHKNSIDFRLPIERNRQETLWIFSDEEQGYRTCGSLGSSDIQGGTKIGVCSQYHDRITHQVSSPSDGEISGGRQLKLNAAPLLHDAGAPQFLQTGTNAI
ncbi:hypothetical protein HAX54_017806 [Datura stramonium]|uniref:Uncharacterized protein n=1 Tax=Datura stramonium TaxID=4076 RepID=A0ABS8UNE5_DATST|nr:hypothetical protein [Datura stramonium]